MNVLGMLYSHTILHILNEKIPINCIYKMLHFIEMCRRISCASKWVFPQI